MAIIDKFEKQLTNWCWATALFMDLKLRRVWNQMKKFISHQVNQ